MGKKWPSGVAVFRWLGETRVGVDLSEWMGSCGRKLIRTGARLDPKIAATVSWVSVSPALIPLNPDARAMLAIAKQGRR